MKESHEEIRQTLKSCKDSKKVDAKHRAQAIGYLSQFEDPMNRFLLIFMEAVALQLNILTETFQKVDCNISTALQTLKSVRKKVNALRAHYTSDKIGALLRADKVEEPLALGKRKRVVSTRFKDSIVTEKLPINRNSPNSRSFTSMRSVVTEVIDTLNSELDERFQQADTALWKAFEHLNPASDSFLEAGELASLLRYALQIPAIRQKLPANVSQEQLNAECTVFRTMISDERDRLHRVGGSARGKRRRTR